MTSTIAVVTSDASTIMPVLASTLVVIDSGVSDSQFLVSGVLPGVTVLVLDGDRDGVEQITTALQQYPELTTLHIIAHGSPACLYLGNSQLSLETIDRYAWDLQSWFSSSAYHPTSLSLYACNVAAGEAGTKLLQKLRLFTGANVYASTGAIGNAQPKSNWQLDATYRNASVIGLGQPILPCEASVLQNYAGILAAPVVANAIGSQLVVKDSAFSFVLPSNTFFDADNNTLTYTATLASGDPLPSWISFSNGTFSGTPGSSDLGSLNIKVTASDGTAAVSDIFTLNVASSLRPVLVQDINLNTGNANPSNLTHINGTLYFTANNGSNGIELWKLDPATGNASLVQDINPGKGNANPSNLTNVDGTLYFTANNGSNGIELWKVDPATGNAALVQDINPGTVASSPYNLTNVDGILYFAANNGSNGIELWKVDPATGNAALVQDINPGTVASSPYNLTNVDGILYFAANNGSNGIELWKVDPATGNAALVQDINPGTGGSSPRNLTNVNGTLYFVANNGSSGEELWKVDPTTGIASLVQDINPGTGSSNPRNLTNVNGTLYFVANNGSSGEELWKVDPTTGIASLVQDINPGTSNSSPRNLTNVNGTLYFAATSSTSGRELWKVDPTTGKASLVQDINLGTGNANPIELTNVNGTLYFTATEPTQGTELWKVNPTTGKASLVQDINLGTGSTNPSNLTNVNGSLFFVATTPTQGTELWQMAINSAPIVKNAIGDQPAYTNYEFDFTIPTNVFGDVENDSLTYKATLANGSALPDWLSFNNGTFTGTPEISDAGSLSIQVTASDGLESVADIFTLTVFPPPKPPISTKNTIDTLEDITRTLTTADFPFFSGDNGSLQSVVIVQTVAGLTLNHTAVSNGQRINLSDINAGNLQYSPAQNANGTALAQFKFRVSDGSADSNIQTMTIDVTAVNDAPSFTKGNDIVIDEDAPAQSIAQWATHLSAGASDETGQTLNFIITTDNDALFATKPAIDIVTGNLTYTLAANANGIANITVQLQDNGGIANAGADTSAVQRFTITVNPTNDPPIIPAPATLTAFENTPRTIHLVTDLGVRDTTDTAPPAAPGAPSFPPLSLFELVTPPANGTISSINLSTGTFVYTPNPNFNGNDSFTYLIHDNGGAAATGTVNMTVNAVNDPPTTIDLSATKVTENNPGAIIGNVIVTDPDSNSFGFTVDDPRFEIVGGKLKLKNGASLNYEAKSSIEIQITATDDGTPPQSKKQSFNLTVEDTNDAPTIGGVPATSSKPDTFYEFIPTVVDEDGNSLTYTIQNKPNWAIFDQQTGRLSGTPTSADLGISKNIIITVSDGKAAPVDLAAFNLSVDNVNTPPTIGGTPATIVDEDSSYSFTPTVVDPDFGTTLIYSITNKPSWANFDTRTGTLNGTPSNSDVGTTEAIVIRVSDDENEVALPGFNLTVQNTNDAPRVVTAIADQAATVGTAFTLTVPAITFSDIDAGDVLALSATLSDGRALPSWLSFDAAAGSFKGTPTEAIPLNIKVTATDQASATTSDEFTLTIAPSPNPDQVPIPGFGPLPAPIPTPGSDPLPAPVPTLGSDPLPTPVTSPLPTPVSTPDPLSGTTGVIPSTHYGKTTRRLNGTPKTDKLTGRNGNDLIRGRNRHDQLKGRGGSDWLIGDRGNDRLEGGNGNDRVDGRWGRDLVIGGKGDDRLLGGLGKDTLIGGAGNDVYVFNKLAFNPDVIIGFDSNSELIDLRSIFARAEYQGSSLAQVVRLEQIGANTEVQVDTDGLGSGTSFATIANLRNVFSSAISSRNFIMS